MNDRPGIPEVQRGLLRSDDGGRAWQEVPTRGDGVLQVEAFRSTLVVVTQGCEGGTPESCVDSSSPTSPPTTRPPDGGW